MWPGIVSSRRRGRAHQLPPLNGKHSLLQLNVANVLFQPTEELCNSHRLLRSELHHRMLLPILL
jgi:hypothetical protein